MRVTVEPQELPALFADEAREYVQQLNEGLLRLEASPGDRECVHGQFRAAHSLKGMAGTMSYEPLVRLTHAMESFFELLRSGHRPAAYGAEAFDLLFEAVSRIGGAKPAFRRRPAPTLWFLSPARRRAARESAVSGARVYAVEVGLDPECVFKGPRAYLVLRRLGELGQIVGTWPPGDAFEDERSDDRFVVALVSAEPPDGIARAVVGVSEVRHAVARPVTLDESPPQTAGSAAVPAQASSAPGAGTGAAAPSTIRVDTARLDALVDLVGELVIATNQVQAQRAQRATVDEALVHKLARVTSDLQGAVMRLRMVPVRLVFSRFPRAVRDLARRFGKRLALVMEGEDTELDRHIVDAIGEPLLHLIRNAVDHGIEPPDVRARLGKPPTATVRLAARHEGNHVVIEVEDDGAGIDLDRVRKKAVESGRLTPEQAADALGEAENEPDAVQKYAELDIVTLDITMPKMDGLAALKALLALDPNSKVIMCSPMGQKSMVTRP